NGVIGLIIVCSHDIYVRITLTNIDFEPSGNASIAWEGLYYG
ncbi:MAG: hypothetical protein ACJAZ0_002241, partial [Halioglobus sp.]